jgi:hypothetical protein
MRPVWNCAHPLLGNRLRPGTFVRYSGISFSRMARLSWIGYFFNDPCSMVFVAPTNPTCFPDCGLSESGGVVHVFALARLF